MAYRKLEIKPGINKDDTSTTNEGRWQDCDFVRFRNGMPEKVGGWVSDVADAAVSGKARAIHVWTTNAGDPLIAIGTHSKLYVIQGGTLYNITPIRQSAALPSFKISTINTDSVVTITYNLHGAIVGDTVIFDNMTTTVDGISLDGEYMVLDVVDSNTFTLDSGTAATGTSTDEPATADNVSFELNVGIAGSGDLCGWGIAKWGEEEWGTPRSVCLAGRPRIWSLDNWGEDLVASPSGGSIYVWDSSAGTGERAQEISGLPAGIRSVDAGIVVSLPDRHLVAFGADRNNPTSPLSVSWSDQEDYTVWTPAPTNSAGAQLLSGASSIIAAHRSRDEILVWTEKGLHSMQWKGQPFVFGFTEVGTECGLFGRNAAVVHQDMAVWMGHHQFFIYDGMVRSLPCPVWETVYGDINESRNDLVFASINTYFNEVTWFYPSAGATEVDRQVTINYVEQVWSVGSLARTCWHDANVLTNPLAVAADGVVYSHENGVDADGSPISSFIESGDMDIADGEEIMFLDRIIPDFVLTGNVLITAKMRPYPFKAQTSKGPFSVGTSTGVINLRARGRQLQLKVESNGLGDDWRLGQLRIDGRPDGLR